MHITEEKGQSIYELDIAGHAAWIRRRRNMEHKTIAIMQPAYMPWIGYFSMIDKVDEFVFLDMVQLTGRSWQVRNKIKLNGAEKLLTIPVRKDKPREERLINQCPYMGEEWKRSHLDTVKTAYGKAPYFSQVYPFLCTLYASRAESIGAFNCRLIREIAEKIGIRTPLISAFQVMGNAQEKKDSLLAAICERRSADCYLSAPGSAAYIEKDSPGGGRYLQKRGYSYLTITTYIRSTGRWGMHLFRILESTTCCLTKGLKEHCRLSEAETGQKLNQGKMRQMSKNRPARLCWHRQTSLHRVFFPLLANQSQYVWYFQKEASSVLPFARRCFFK